MKKSFSNKVFSYKNRILKGKNYSRKNFENTMNYNISFIDCIFQQTIFKDSMLKKCLFENCKFSKFEFSNIVFEEVIFKNCTFNSILFNKCKFEFSKFDLNNNFNLTFMYPDNICIEGFINCNRHIKHNHNEIKKLLEEVILHKQIRESNTLFKKVRKPWPKDIKRKLKHIKKKDGDFLGLTKKQRLEENARRKKIRKELQAKNYNDSLIGKNRKIDKAIFNFLMNMYTDDELERGIKYAMQKIKVSFSSLSILIKYIDEGISLK